MTSQYIKTATITLKRMEEEVAEGINIRSSGLNMIDHIDPDGFELFGQ